PRPQPADRGYLEKGRKMARVAKRRKAATRPKPLKPAKVVPLSVEPLPPAPTCSPVTLLELPDDSCHWPVGDAEGEAQMFCGAPRPERPASNKHPGRSYCPFHARVSVSTARASSYRTAKSDGSLRRYLRPERSRVPVTATVWPFRWASTAFK